MSSGGTKRVRVPGVVIFNLIKDEYRGGQEQYHHQTEYSLSQETNLHDKVAFRSGLDARTERWLWRNLVDVLVEKPGTSSARSRRWRSIFGSGVNLWASRARLGICVTGDNHRLDE
jgi:hypothetical protein